MTINLTQVAPVITESHKANKEQTASGIILHPREREVNVIRVNMTIEALFTEAKNLYEQAEILAQILFLSDVFLPGMNPEVQRLNREAQHKASLARGVWRMMEKRNLPVHITVNGFYAPPAECACNGTSFDPPSCPVCNPNLNDDEMPY